jgi:hypothetical protein
MQRDWTGNTAFVRRHSLMSEGDTGVAEGEEESEASPSSH